MAVRTPRAGADSTTNAAPTHSFRSTSALSRTQSACHLRCRGANSRGPHTSNNVAWRCPAAMSSSESARYFMKTSSVISPVTVIRINGARVRSIKIDGPSLIERRSSELGVTRLWVTIAAKPCINPYGRIRKSLRSECCHNCGHVVQRYWTHAGNNGVHSRCKTRRRCNQPVQHERCASPCNARLSDSSRGPRILLPRQLNYGDPTQLR